MLKVLQASSTWTKNFQMYKLGFENAEEPRDQIANICWIIEKAKGIPEKHLLLLHNYAEAFDCMDHNKLENS